jgi:hypothetical protein
VISTAEASGSKRQTQDAAFIRTAF